MTTDLETHILNGQALNDGSVFTIESFTFTPAQKQQQWAGNANADGEALVKESHYTPSYFEYQIRVNPQASADVGREKVGLLIDAVQSCERIDGGADLDWIPNNSADEYTAHALSADFTDLPIEETGDLAGWLLAAPVIKFKATCRSFLDKETRTAYTATESGAEPQQVLYVEAGGDVPAEAELIVTDTATQDRRYLRVGQDGSDPLRTNLVTNPSFETNTTSWSLSAPSWASSALTRPAATWDGVTGQFAGHVTLTKDATATNRSCTFYVKTETGSITPGKPYSASFAFKPLDNPNNFSGYKARIEWYTAAAAHISDSSEVAFGATGVVDGRVEVVNQTAPALASYALVVVALSSNVSGDIVTFEIDSVLLEQSATAGTYFDGTTANGKWSGTAHASKSTNYASTLITAASLVTTGFSGEAKTRSGAYSEEKVKRATAISQPTTMCGTGGITHVGSCRVFARVYADSALARYRISYRSGGGPLIPIANPGWVAPHAVENFSTLDLGEVTFDRAENGEQRSEVRVEVKTSSGVPISVDLNYLELVPSTGGFFRARGLTNNVPTKLLAYDNFEKATEGNLDTPKALELGGNWSEAVRTGANGFKLIAGETKAARRTTVSDTGITAGGSFAIAGSEEPTTASVSATISSAGYDIFETETFRRGVFLRYTEPEKWVMAVFANVGPGRLNFSVIKRVGASIIYLGSWEGVTPGRNQGHAKTELPELTVRLMATAEGVWDASLITGGQTLAELSGQDSALATGGALATGKAGMYDVYISSEAMTRYYDNFQLLAGEPAGRVCYSGKNCRLTSDGFTRQDSEGKYEGQASLARGMNLYLRPGTNRLVVAMRRNDVDAEVDGNVTDKHSAEVKAIERYLAPR